MGAPIYLVSACASGEEFIAAFRRYADKHGLFVPIGEPLPPGRRSRFALTLRDGGVMIEGEAEIVSAARTPSLLHGRIGMTLKFVDTDAASRTTLSELERARLSMKPPPPSVPPRPAEIPDEPRPSPPPLQGRIDAVNALAECVAIGDVAALGPPLPPAPPPPAKSGRVTLPPIPSGGRSAPGTSPPGGLGAAPQAAAPARSPTAPPPIVMKPADRAGPAAAEPPAVTPRATPQPDRLRDAERASVPDPVSGLSQTMTAIAVAPGPASDTMIVAEPPAPPPPLATGAAGTQPTERFDKGPLSATMFAVPVPSEHPPSAPTEIGGALVVPIFADDDPSARTQIHAGAPRPPAQAATPEPAEPPRTAEPRSGGFVPTTPVTVSGMPPMRPPALASPPEVEIAEPTDISMPPEPPSSPSARLAVEAGWTEPEAAALVGGSLASLALDAAALEESGAVTNELAAESGAGPAAARPRRTVMGVAVVPSDVLVPPAAPARRAAAAGDEIADDSDEATSHARISVGDQAVDVGAPTLRPEAGMFATPDEPTQYAGWAPTAVAAPAPPAPAPAPPPGTGNGLPSGDWTIALDPSAPDGWSSPSQTIPREELEDGAPPPVHVNTAPMSPLAMAAAASAPGEVPAVEPKVQIDPTLIEPLRGVAAEGAPGTAPELTPEVAMYGTGPSLEPVDAPALRMMMAVPHTGPFPPHIPPALHPPAIHPAQGIHPGQAGYALDPSYQRMAGMQPGLVTADGSGFGELHYASNPAMAVQVRRRRLIIVLAAAVAAVLLGIVAMLVFRGTGASSEPAAPRPPPPAVEPPAAPAAGAAAPSPAAPAAGTTGDGTTGAAAAPAAAPAAAAGECFAEVTSQPAGADIVLDQTHVIGTTPQRVALPCGSPVELLIRKQRLVPTSRTVTPTPTGAPVQVVLVRQTFLVKVNSTPAGATVMLGGRSLGVTPTMVKVPAFEASLLNITKDGYEVDTQRVAPRGNGAAVHAVLKKLERKRSH